MSLRDFQRIHSDAQDQSLLGSVIADIKSLVVDLHSCIFKHVHLDLNVAAHLLACNSEHSVCNFSVDVIPECIREVLCNDVPYNQ